MPTPPRALGRPPLPVGLDERKSIARKALRRLAADYPDADCALRHDTPVQLLVATILSAQCTDARVNLITEKLFADYPTAEAIAAMPLRKLEKYVQSAGFFRNKAKNIKACCTDLVRKHGGEVPRTLDELVELAGVGRKTANVVLGTAYGIAVGVVVDTHVGRISRRLGLTEEKDPVKAERDLMLLLPKSRWVDFSHQMIYHGRQVCDARRPDCTSCSMRRFCPRVGVPSP